MKKRRFAKMFNFWLDLNRPDEYELAETVDNLKQARQFSQVIRDGLRIIPALLAGNPDPLLERFPWVIDMVLARYGQPTPEPPKANGNTSGGDGLERKIDRLEQLIIRQGMNPNPSIAAVAPVMSGNLIAGAVAVQFTPPPMDDDFDFMADVEIKKDENAGAVASQNLRNQLMQMYNGQGVWASKAPDASKPSRAGRGKQLEQSLA
jgi:hypothetical protein